jgi:DNA-nicking Smr family endonuclease
MNDKDNNLNDGDIFSQAMSDVKPHEHDKISLHKKPGKIKKQTQLQTHFIEDTLSDDFIPECGNFLEFIRPGIQNSLLKQIRNGKLPVEDHLDLHGYNRDDTRKNLLAFISHAQGQGYKIVCIVHGKGYHSEDGRPVLKAMVNKWLQNINEVLAFVTAQPKDGGTGAVYALIKRAKN